MIGWLVPAEWLMQGEMMMTKAINREQEQGIILLQCWATDWSNDWGTETEGRMNQRHSPDFLPAGGKSAPVMWHQAEHTCRVWFVVEGRQSVWRKVERQSEELFLISCLRKNIITAVRRELVTKPLICVTQKGVPSTARDRCVRA